MVDYFIKLFSKFLAREIETGSAPGAIIGTLLGILIGVLSSYLLVRGKIVDGEFAVAIYLILCIPLAMAGALIGAATGPRRRSKPSQISIRLTRYNAAGGTLAVTLILLAVVVLLIVVTQKKYASADTSNAEMWAIGAVITVMALISLYRTLREIWYVDIGPMIYVCRLIGSRSYSHGDLRMWGFEIRPNEVMQKPFSGTRTLCLQTHDGCIYRIQARGEDSQAIVDALASPGFRQPIA